MKKKYIIFEKGDIVGLDAKESVWSMILDFCNNEEGDIANSNFQVIVKHFRKKESKK